MRNIDQIIIHHTATPQITTVKSIRDYHVDERGWDDIGYHYLIKPDGYFRLGRPVWKIGAHCKGRNRNSIGIAVMGNYEKTKPDWEIGYPLCIIDQLGYLIKDLQHRYPDIAIGHHSQFANTLCPGRYLIEVLKKKGWVNNERCN